MDYRVGSAFITMIISVIALIIIMIISGIIYLIAWSRMIMILLYVSVAPLPMVTLLNNDWVGSMGQNYIKNLMALMLQGFLMLVLLVIYGGLVNRTSILIAENNNGVYGVILMVVSMAIVAKMLVGTQALSKSIVGAN